MRRLLPILFVAVAINAPSAARVPDILTVTFPDIGQGDAILIQAPNGAAMLVDTNRSWTAPRVTAG